MIWSINVCSVTRDPLTFRRLWQLPSRHLPLNRLEDWLFPFPPCYSKEDSFPAHRVNSPSWTRAGRQSNSPPVTITILKEVGMTNSLEIFRGVAICQNRVSAITLIRTSDILGSSDCHAMSKFSTPLRNHEIVPTILLINMRALRSCTACACPYFGFRSKDTCLQIYCLLHDASP